MVHGWRGGGGGGTCGISCGASPGVPPPPTVELDNQNIVVGACQREDAPLIMSVLPRRTCEGYTRVRLLMAGGGLSDAQQW